jgi:hypothetical protein
MTTTTRRNRLDSKCSDRRPRRASNRQFRPALCALEGRQLLSTFTWDSASSGVFSNPRNWTDQYGRHGVPGPADTAVIPGSGFTVSVAQSTTVGSLRSKAQVAITCGTLTIENLCQDSSIASLSLNPRTTLDVAGGQLDLLGNSTLAGTLSAARGSSIEFTGGRQIICPGAVLTGPGRYILDDGPCGSLIVEGCLTAPANFDFKGGDLDLAGTLLIPGQFNWTGGTMRGAGKAVVQPCGTLNIVTCATTTLQNDATIVNDGTVAWSEAGGAISGDGLIDNCGRFGIYGRNPSQQTHSNPIDGTFINNGLLLVSGALPTIDSLCSSGTIDVTCDGYLTIAGNSRLSGPINADAGTTVSFYGALNGQGNYVPGVAQIDPGSVFRGPGFYSVWDGDTLRLNTDVAPSNFLVAGGSVLGCGVLSVGNLLQFSGGMIAPAVVDVGPSALFRIDNYYDDSAYGWTLAAATVNLAGQTDWNTPGALWLGGNTIINNLHGATFLVHCDQPMTSGKFNNAGSLIKAYDAQSKSGNGTTAIGTTLSNTGTVTVDSGTLYLGPVVQVSSGVLTGGTWSVVDATGAGASLVMSLAGGINTIGPAAAVTLDGPGTTFSNLGSLSANEGTFSLLDGQSFGTSGSLANYGTITLGAGDALGVRGTFGQAPTATLNLTIGGTSSSGLVSHLYVTGDAYFGGTLRVLVPSGFIPVFNDRYSLLTYRHVRSFFGAISIPSFSNGEYFTGSYTANNFILRVR